MPQTGVDTRFNSRDVPRPRLEAYDAGMNSTSPLLLAGVGFVAEAVAAAASGRRIAGTTRRPQSAAYLQSLGIEPLVVIPGAESALTERLIDADVVVSFPPDGRTDARMAALMESARRIVYVSSTGVYGDTRGRIDNETPAAPNDEVGRLRLDAEESWRSAGATVVRAPGIYGPGRGLHRSLQTGSYRLPGDGSGVISRIHVDDLAGVLLAALDRDVAGRTFVVADLCAVPQREVVEWLCERLGRALPPSTPLDQAPRTLRGSRAVDPAETLSELGVSLRYPSSREGFDACLTAKEPIPVIAADQNRER